MKYIHKYPITMCLLVVVACGMSCFTKDLADPKENLAFVVT